jgi:hypothetical protein
MYEGAKTEAMMLLKYLLTMIFLAPTLWAITDVLRRPTDRFPTGRKGPWLLILVIGGATMFAFLPPIIYYLTVRLKGGPAGGPLFRRAHH